ncbi:hypothetical protein MLD38_011397 [Melastoma candidum]|uniref:Uncharacterized protein n=1 Tax=Melastoma candidum TaxID=119954 RepID=A0ACB9RB89_9MYRT|nr:hypothetical protein MLD38_011397 [Melastoma candidum]
MHFCVMDSFHRLPPIPSRRRGLRGNRPPLLRVHRGSHSIRKFPGKVPAVGGQPGRPSPPPPPVIIHEVSPEVIHVPPEGFKETVQRLTGRPSNPCFDVHNEQVRQSQVPYLTRGEAGTSTFGSAPSQLDFPTGPAPDNVPIPSSGANQELSIYDMCPEFDGDNLTTTACDHNAPGQSLDDFFRFTKF